MASTGSLRIVERNGKPRRGDESVGRAGVVTCDEVLISVVVFSGERNASVCHG